MDTVSMLNTMSFYCQPILPLVYDESMSYYETLCKVVGQLNTTGETVNKLNEGLTGEIADRQAADAALDARIKQIEETNRKIHFLKVDTLGHLLTPDVTREKLSQWVQNGELITMLYAPDELENSWAVASNYRCMGATGADTMQLNFYVPVSIMHNAGKSGSDVAQEVVVISLPTGALANQWVVRTITTTIPRTNADGFVNLTATVSDAGAVTCDVEPGAIVEALRNYFSGTNQYAVAVNARLNYDGKQYHSGAATVKADSSGTGNIRIAFENYYDGVRAENGVRQTVNTTIFLVGDVKTNAWSVETIDHKTFDFSRYEGFQFTRGANNVITTNDESTPNAVYAQYHSDTSGKLYQNLPTRLIDSVDGAEYWNGTFDIYGGNHMTFTFVTSNYATSSHKMLVRVIELSADVGTTAWKYGVKEFELPFVGYDLIVVTSSKVTDLGYDASEGASKYTVIFDASFDSILANLAANKPMKFNITLPDSTTGLSVSFNTGYVSVLNDSLYLFTGTIASSPAVLSISKLGSATVYLYADYLPEPNPDDSDDGKVLAVNKHKWEIKTPTGGGSTFADDGAGNISVDGAAAQSANRFLQSLTFPGLNFKYLNPMNSGTYSDPYGVKVASGASLIETVLAMATPGVYTVYMNRSATDVPEAAAAASSSLRGLLILSQINKHYAVVMMVDQLGNFYVQYIQNDVGGGWKQMPDSSAVADAVLYTAQTLTSPQQVQARKNIGALGSVSPNIKNFMIITPQNEADGTGVALSARGTGGNFTLDISDANEGQPTKLLGLKTPTDAETHAATTVEYVLGKIANVPVVPVDAVMSDTSGHAVQNKVIKKYVDDSAAKKLNQTEPVIKDGLTVESGSFAIYVQPNGQTSATGEDFASLNFTDNSPEGSGSGIVLSGLANFGDAEAVGLEDTAVSYAQLVEYTTPLTLTYANNQVTGASYADIRKAITRGRQIKLAVANMPDVVVANAKNETDRSVLSFIDISVGGDTVGFAQYSVVAQASGITATVKSMQLP